ncbi:MAG TPA: hypothetical protein VK660_10120, partial [Xanthomonadaceae bacterium]|nr:hypothetical protein [Xanthomonadaceae bacterium]
TGAARNDLFSVRHRRLLESNLVESLGRAAGLPWINWSAPSWIRGARPSSSIDTRFCHQSVIKPSDAEQ